MYLQDVSGERCTFGVEMINPNITHLKERRREREKEEDQFQVHLNSLDDTFPLTIIHMVYLLNLRFPVEPLKKQILHVLNETAYGGRLLTGTRRHRDSLRTLCG